MIGAKLLAHYAGARYTLAGDTYAGLTWLDPSRPRPSAAELDALPAPPPRPVPPESISNFQARAIMLRTPLKDGSGTSLFAAVDGHLKQAALDAASLPDADPTKIAALTALNAWERGSIVLRRGDLVLSLQAAFGFDDAEADALFVAGAQIVA